MRPRLASLSPLGSLTRPPERRAPQCKPQWSGGLWKVWHLARPHFLVSLLVAWSFFRVNPLSLPVTTCHYLSRLSIASLIVTANPFLSSFTLFCLRLSASISATARAIGSAYMSFTSPAYMPVLVVCTALPVYILALVVLDAIPEPSPADRAVLACMQSSRTPANHRVPRPDQSASPCLQPSARLS